MSFKPLSTQGVETSKSKTLIYGTAGAGKTTQAKHFQEEFGAGFILSGESGLQSIRDSKIDYLPFSSFKGVAPQGEYSFEQICRLMMTPEFKAMDYKWIMLDSLTELSDRCFEYCQAEARRTNEKNGFKLWGDYAEGMITACKWLRDLPYHVIVSSLITEERDEDGNIAFSPLVKGAKVAGQLNGLFDNVFALVKKTVKGPDGKPMIQRVIVTDTIMGYSCKSRDPKRVLQPIETTSNSAELVKRVLEAK